MHRDDAAAVVDSRGGVDDVVDGAVAGEDVDEDVVEGDEEEDADSTDPADDMRLQQLVEVPGGF